MLFDSTFFTSCLSMKSVQVVRIKSVNCDKSAVKFENKITHTFLCHNGVKQGCMLSPTLFIYLSDLPEMLNILINLSN